MKIVILKNTTGSVFLVHGREIPAGGQRDISDIPTVVLREDTALVTAIQNGDIIVNDGTNDLSVVSALIFMSFGFSLSIKVDGIAITSPIAYIDTIDFKGGALIIDEGTGTVTVEVGSVGGTGFGAYSDVLEFGDSGTVGNKFLKSSYSNHTSVDSTAIAIGSGEVVHCTISTEQDPTNNFFLQIVINATKGGAGDLAGGTQIGTDLEKPTAILDKLHTDLTGYSFSVGDRIQVRVKEGTLGGKKAVEPVVRLFVRYD